VRLRINLIANGRYWTAGQEIDESEVPANLCRFATANDNDVKPEANAKPSVSRKAGKRAKG
jgi:hypothetical protein